MSLTAVLAVGSAVWAGPALAIRSIAPSRPAESASPSASAEGRAGDDSHSSAAHGVLAEMDTPGSLRGVRAGSPSGADVYLQAPDGDFVQAGWYVGSLEDLPYSSAPRMFVGELNPGSRYGETLRAGPGIGWLSSRQVRIRYAGNGGKYNFYLAGKFVASTSIEHPELLTDAAFNGETDDNTTEMNALAFFPGTNKSTLRWEDYTGSLHYFADHYFATSGTISVPYQGPATCEAIG